MLIRREDLGQVGVKGRRGHKCSDNDRNVEAEPKCHRLANL